MFNDKFQRRIWSLVYQFSGVLENERKGVRGRGTRTPLDPLDINSPTLSGSRHSDRGDGAEICKQKKKTARPILLLLLLLLLFHLPLFFHSFAVRLRHSPLRFRFVFFCIRSPEAWQLLKVAVSLKPASVKRLYSVNSKSIWYECNKTWLVC